MNQETCVWGFLIRLWCMHTRQSYANTTLMYMSLIHHHPSCPSSTLQCLLWHVSPSNLSLLFFSLKSIALHLGLWILPRKLDLFLLCLPHAAVFSFPLLIVFTSWKPPPPPPPDCYSVLTIFAFQWWSFIHVLAQWLSSCMHTSSLCCPTLPLSLCSSSSSLSWGVCLNVFFLSVTWLSPTRQEDCLSLWQPTCGNFPSLMTRNMPITSPDVSLPIRR